MTSKTNLDRILRRMNRRARAGIDNCSVCDGVGTREYFGGGWRKGMSASTMRVDVCDRCWGSGDSSQPGANIADLEAAREVWKAEQALLHFARETGAAIPSQRAYILAIVDLLNREERRRKTPFKDNTQDVFWRATLRSVSYALRRCAASDVKR